MMGTLSKMFRIPRKATRAAQSRGLSASRVTAVVVLALAIVTFTVLNSRATKSMSNFATESSGGQEQMQFPEGLDYSKFQHDSRNHSRLPCLLCHRRETNAPIPKRPGGSGHLPCAGCHAQQFSTSDSPI